MTQATILASLQDGAKSWEELPSLGSNERKDCVLLGLKNANKIVRIGNGYARPPKPLKDPPLIPSVLAPEPPEKACARCEVTKPIDQFTRDGVGRTRRATCSECLNKLRKQRHDNEVQKSNAKVCTVCEKKRRIGHFGFSGKNRTNVCFYCREAA